MPRKPALAGSVTDVWKRPAGQVPTVVRRRGRERGRGL